MAFDYENVTALLTAIEERIPFGRRVVSAMLFVGVLAWFAFCLSIISPVFDGIFRRVIGVRATPWPTITLGEILVMTVVIGGSILFSRAAQKRLSHLGKAITEMTTHTINTLERSQRELASSNDLLKEAQQQIEALQQRVDSTERQQQWLALADRFKQIRDSSLNAEWSRTDPPGTEEWTIDGTRSSVQDAEALCRLAGAMLTDSAKIAPNLSSQIREQNDPSWRWLYFLKDRYRLEDTIEAEGHSRGIEHSSVGGSIESLAAVSARGCIECSAMEI